MQTPTDEIEAATTPSGSQNHATCQSSAEPTSYHHITQRGTGACPKMFRLQPTVTSIYIYMWPCGKKDHARINSL